jgi:excisionase family DNA binding protein
VRQHPSEVRLEASPKLKSRPEVLPLLFSQREASRILAISLRTLQSLVASKQLPVRRIGRRVLITRKDLEAFARRDHPSTSGGE